MNDHVLTAYEGYFLEDGVAALCSCGWKSDRVDSMASALCEHQIHAREMKREGQLANA
jgi:hypothetical protein